MLCTMSRFCCLVAIILSTHHLSNAEIRLPKSAQCEASNGRCGSKDFTCDNTFGLGWRIVGRCCSKRPCCKFHCEDIQLRNGTVTISDSGSAGVNATFSCDKGFTLLGNSSITCSETGFDGYAPICFACPETVVYFGGSTYIFNCGGFTWFEAESYCKRQGGDLTSIENEAENNFLRHVAALVRTTGQASPDHYWIGLTDIKTEGLFEWQSGQPLIYNDWYKDTPIEPDNLDVYGNSTDVDCASLKPIYMFHWGDERCTFSICQALCEIK